MTQIQAGVFQRAPPSRVTGVSKNYKAPPRSTLANEPKPLMRRQDSGVLRGLGIGHSIADTQCVGASQMKMSRSIIHSLLASAIALSPVAHAPFASAADQPAHETMIARSPQINRPDLKIETTIETLNREEVSAELTKELSAEPAQSLTVVSTDVDAVIEQAARSKTVLLPFGRAIRKSADVAGGINAYIRNYPAYAAKAIKDDRIGFGITVFSLGNETVRWLHVADASTFQMSANLIYSLLWTAAFLDQDTWSNATRPIQLKWRKLFKMSLVIPEQTTASDMAIKFLSGATLSVGLNTGRAAIVGIDQFSRHVLDVSHIGMPILMGIAMTSVGFSWSELTGSIKEEMYPRAKRIVKAAMNSRKVLTSFLASTAMLMNPATFGWHPWVIVSISGTLGAITFINAGRIIPRLEIAAKRAQRALPGYRPMTCEAIF